MRTTSGWRRVFECVHTGWTWLRGRGRIHPWQLRSVLTGSLAGIIALSMVTLASRGVAAEAAKSAAPRVGDGRLELPRAGKTVYKPRVIGGTRHRQPRVDPGQAPPPPAGECPACDPVGVLDAKNFSEPTEIDGDWLPLEPGTQLVLQGVANRGGGLLPHNVIFTVTDLTKRINGIPCVVVWDQDINEGVLSESELAFFAQDDAGNVWNTGEYPEEYFEGVFIGAENTWIHGIENAQAGVTVQARPRLGTLGYQEAIAPENDFWDCGMVFATSKVRTCLPFGCYKRSLVIKEWAPLDGCSVIQLKTYAKGVGVVQVGAIDDPEGETLVLVAVNHLSRTQMDAARASALALDAHGYLVNEIYFQTEPAQRAPRERERHRDHGDDGDDRGDRGDRDAARIVDASAAQLHVSMSIAPNPATNLTGISYSLAKAGRAEIGIFDVAGRRIRSLVDEDMPAGTYRVQWNGRDDGGKSVSGGVYFARLRTGTEVVRRTIVVAK